MKKVLLIILVITAMLVVLVSCNNDDPSNTTIVTTTQVTTTSTSAISTTAAEIYTPEDAYPNQYYGYMMTLGDSHISYGYKLKSQKKNISSVPANRKKTFEFNGVEYVLVYHSSNIGYYEDYVEDSYLACHPDSDYKNPLKTSSFTVDFNRRTGQLIGVWASSVIGYEGEDFYLGEMEEKKEYTEEELTEYAKKMAKEYIEKFGLDMNVDECVLRIKRSPSSNPRNGKQYHFFKCLDGVPTNEYIRIDVNQFGKFMGAQTAGIGMYDEFANAKIDIDAIKSRTSNITSVTLINDEGTLVAKIDYEVYEENYPDAAEFGDPEYIWREYTKYRPLVPKEIEKE